MLLKIPKKLCFTSFRSSFSRLMNYETYQALMVALASPPIVCSIPGPDTTNTTPGLTRKQTENTFGNHLHCAKKQKDYKKH